MLHAFPCLPTLVADHGHLLTCFFSLYPLFIAVSAEMSDWYKQRVEDHYGVERTDERLRAIMRDNALGMFPRLRERIFAINHSRQEGYRRFRCML